MANNRMILLCNVCKPDDYNWGYGEKGVLPIAKWYPAGDGIGGDDGSYYRNDNGRAFGKEFLKFLEEHQHREVASEHYKKGAGQENPVRLVYERKGLPILAAKGTA